MCTTENHINKQQANSLILTASRERIHNGMPEFSRNCKHNTPQNQNTLWCPLNKICNSIKKRTYSPTLLATDVLLDNLLNIFLNIVNPDEHKRETTDTEKLWISKDIGCISSVLSNHFSLMEYHHRTNII